MHSELVRILLRGYQRSDTFRTFVDTLEMSDLIVYIDHVGERDRGVAGAMRFVSHAGGHRYLRITLYGARSIAASIALLGHELQHAAEVAGASWVIDQETCGAFYRTIGHREWCRGSAECFDTAAAIEAAGVARAARQCRLGTFQNPLLRLLW
jgi:hypothetical protein